MTTPSPRGADTVPYVRVTLADGRVLLVPPELAERRPDGTLAVPVEQLLPSGAAEVVGDESTTIPVIREELEVERRLVPKGGVRVHKRVEERHRTVEAPLLHERLEIERRPVNAFVAHEDPPQVREEADVLVVPLLEEVLVVEKRLLLREEVRIARVREERQSEQEVVLRSERVDIERIDAASDARASQGPAGPFTDAVIDVQARDDEPHLRKTARVVEEVRVAKTATERTEEVRGTVRDTDVRVEGGDEEPAASRGAPD